MRTITSTFFGTLFFGLVSISTQAQITILDTDMPLAGDTFRLSSALGGGGGGGGQTDYLLTQTGANQTWYYTFLTYKSQSVDTFYSPLQTPISYNFVFTNLILYPDNFADLAQRSTTIPTPPDGGGSSGFFTISDAYDFIQSFSDQYAIVGNAFKLNDVPSANPFEGKDVIYEFPLNFQDTYSSASSYDVQVPSFIEFYHSQVRTNEVDGWGKLYTPYGEWENVLRVKSTIVANDSVVLLQGPFPFPFSFPSTTIEYKWLAKNIGIPVLHIITRESSGFGGGGGQTAVTEVQYIDSINPGTYQIDQTGLMELEKNGFVVYPNPAQGQLTVLAQKVSNSAILVKDLQGRLILSQPSKGLETTLDLSSLKAGMYTLEFNGQVVKWAKAE
jgi:hypothetical protein